MMRSGGSYSRTFFKAAGVGLLCLLLAGCSGSYSKQDTGAIIGATAGAILGSTIGRGSGRAAATAVGLIFGAMVGESVGKSLDRADRIALGGAERRAKIAPIGETITWNNPESGNHGTIIPVREGQSERGEYCREFQQTVIIGGKEEKAYGTACRQPDGSWRVLQR